MDALAVEFLAHSGALVVTALVSDRGEQFYESRTFYGYTVDDARDLFASHVYLMGYELVTD